MKKIILFSVLVLAFIFLTGCSSEQGTLVMKITDAPSQLNIESALVTISSVEVHKAGTAMDNSTEVEEESAEEVEAEETTTEETEEEMDVQETNSGWFTVVEEAQTFDLIELINVTDVLGQTQLDAGKYTQVRLNLESAVVTIDGEEYNLEVPSEKIKLTKGFNLVAGETTTLTLDFDAQESIFATGKGDYKLKPTIKVLQE